MKFILYDYNLKKIANRIWKSKFLNNLAIYRYILKRQIDKKIRICADKPECVRIENTNLCNAACSMCPREGMTRDAGVMDDSLFKEIIRQCSDYKIENINLHNFGEPLIDKSLIDKVRFAKQNGIKKITTNTNAALLNKKISLGLLEAGLDELFVSIDACKKETYQALRSGLNYDKLIRNLMDFVELKKKMQDRTKLIVSFVITPLNIGEIKEFIRFWKNKADYISISYAHDWIGFDKDKLKNKRMTYPCKLPFTELTIAWNGDYILCCADFDASVILGSFKESDLVKTWKENEILSRYRREQLDNYGFKIPPCNKCTLNTVWWL